MNSSYESVDIWNEWDDLGWTQLETNMPLDDFGAEYGSVNYSPYGNEVGDAQGSRCIHQRPVELSGRSESVNAARLQDDHEYLDTIYASRGDNVPYLMDGTMYPDYFDSLTIRTDPPNTEGLQRQSLRFEGDLYTAVWVRGEGIERAGWCGFCSSWHKLKDSAFWFVASSLRSPIVARILTVSF